MTREAVLVTAGLLQDCRALECSRSAFETFAWSFAFGHALGALVAAAFAIFTFVLAFMSSFALVK